MNTPKELDEQSSVAIRILSDMVMELNEVHLEEGFAALGAFSIIACHTNDGLLSTPIIVTDRPELSTQASNLLDRAMGEAMIEAGRNMLSRAGEE